MKHYNFSSILPSLVLNILLISACTPTTKQSLDERIESISRAEMESVAQLLGDDLYEGRAPGTRGGDLAEMTMQGLFKFMDLDPGMEDSYFQPFVMTGFSNNGFEVSANGAELKYIDDIVGTFSVEQEEVDLAGIDLGALDLRLASILSGALVDAIS